MEDAKFTPIITFIRRALKVSGCDIFDENWRPNAWTIIALSLTSPFPCWTLIFLANHFHHMSYEQVADGIASMITGLGAVFGIFEIVINRKGWNIVMREIHNRRFMFKSNQISKLFDRYYERNLLICKALYSVYVSSALSYSFLPMVFPDPDKYNLPLACIIPYLQPSDAYFYPVNYMYHVTVIFVVQHALIAQCVSLISGIMSACCQIHALKKKLDDFNEQINDSAIEPDTIRESLGEIIYLHVCIKEYLALIQQKYGLVYLSVYALCGGLVCTCLNVIADDVFTSATVLIMAGGFSVLIHCFFGNQLLIENDGLPENIYAIDWHKLGLSEQKALKLLLANAQLDAEMHGILMPLNMGTFVSVSGECEGLACDKCIL